MYMDRFGQDLIVVYLTTCQPKFPDYWSTGGQEKRVIGPTFEAKYGNRNLKDDASTECQKRKYDYEATT